MKKVIGILGIASKVLTFILLTAVTAISLMTAYIMFAPDEFPKPFRLVYNLTGVPSTVAISNSTASNHGEGGSETHGEETSGGHGETEAGKEETASHTPAPGVMVNMATKIINLADPSGRKYIRLTVVLEFEPPVVEETTTKKAASSHGGEGEALTPAQEFENSITALMPMMDDAVITLLSTKTYEQLYTAEGKENLRLELRDAIQTRLPDYKLRNIYFTEFVVQ